MWIYTKFGSLIFLKIVVMNFNNHIVTQERGRGGGGGGGGGGGVEYL